MENEFIFIATRPNQELFSLYEDIGKLEIVQDMDKNAKTERALRFIDVLSEEECARVLKEAHNTIIKSHEIELPSSFKVKAEIELVERVMQKFRSAFNITRVKWLFFLKVIMNAYYIHLIDEKKINKMLTKSIDENEGIDDLARFNASVVISNTLLYNRPEDAEYIEKIMQIAEKIMDRNNDK